MPIAPSKPCAVTRTRTRTYLAPAIAVFGLVTVALLGGSTPAKAYQGPWCAFYSNGNEDCSLPSREMCNFTVQYRPSIGRCYPNDRYRPAYRSEQRVIKHRYQRQYD
jgi:hypothetical protein